MLGVQWLVHYYLFSGRVGYYCVFSNRVIVLSETALLYRSEFSGRVGVLDGKAGLLLDIHWQSPCVTRYWMVWWEYFIGRVGV